MTRQAALTCLAECYRDDHRPWIAVPPDERAAFHLLLLCIFSLPDGRARGDSAPRE